MKKIISFLILIVISISLYAQCTTCSVRVTSGTNPICDTTHLDWATWSSINSNSATGHISSNLNMTVNISTTGLFSTGGMYNPTVFPTQYNLPVSSTSIANSQAGVFTFCFSSPVIDPQIALASVGNPNLSVQINTSACYQVIWQGQGMTYPNNTTLIGAEGFTIIKFPGIHTCISFNYLQSEYYCNLAFGIMDTNCQKVIPPPICVGNSVTLTASGATNLTWSPSTGLNTTSGSTVIASPSITTKYFVTNGNCTDSILVTVINPSVLANTITSTSPITIGSSTTLGITGGTLGTNANWNWYTGSCGGTYLKSGPSTIQTPTVTTTYYIRAEGICNTTPCLSTTVVVNSYSSPATSASSLPMDICSGDSTVLSVLGGGLGASANWYWYSNSCGGTFIGTGASITLFPTTSTIYFVRAEGVNNTTTCVSITVSLLGNSIVPISISTTNNSINQGNSTFLSIIGGVLGTAANWYWYENSCGGNIVGYGDTITLNPIVSTTYYLRAEGFCNSTSCVSITITVFPLSINNLSDKSNDLIVEPNPAKDILNIHYTISNSGNVNIEMFNSSGIKIIDIVNSKQIKGKYIKAVNLKSLPSGIYTCKMKLDNSNVIVKRVIISK